MPVGFVMNPWIEGPYEQVRNRRIVQAAYDVLAGATRASQKTFAVQHA
jgi:hypothetical protein